MAPNGWATPEEREFLTSFVPEYEACQVKRRYKSFWQRVNAEFLTKFPMIDKMFPGCKVTDLNAEQKEMYTAALLKQQQRLKEWFRWKMNPRSRTASGAALTRKDLHSIYNGRTRRSIPYEVYARLYPEEVEKARDDRCEEKGLDGRQKLRIWHEVAKELYSSTSADKKEAVRIAMLDEEKEEASVHSLASTPAEYNRYLKKLPALVDATVTPAVIKAGVLALVTIVGPDPEQNGKIVCKTVQCGDKPQTPVFSQEWGGHDSVFAEELARFARRHEFPPDICAARSLNAASDGSSSCHSKEEEDEGDDHEPERSPSPKPDPPREERPRIETPPLPHNAGTSDNETPSTTCSPKSPSASLPNRLGTAILPDDGPRNDLAVQAPSRQSSFRPLPFRTLNPNNKSSSPIVVSQASASKKLKSTSQKELGSWKKTDHEWRSSDKGVRPTAGGSSISSATRHPPSAGQSYPLSFDEYLDQHSGQKSAQALERFSSPDMDDILDAPNSPLLDSSPGGSDSSTQRAPSGIVNLEDLLQHILPRHRLTRLCLSAPPVSPPPVHITCSPTSTHMVVDHLHLYPDIPVPPSCPRRAPLCSRLASPTLLSTPPLPGQILPLMVTSDQNHRQVVMRQVLRTHASRSHTLEGLVLDSVASLMPRVYPRTSTLRASTPVLYDPTLRSSISTSLRRYKGRRNASATNDPQFSRSRRP
ncbi:hypothetical protein NMY22_g17440 [Coprinellus aureogranulatus]|nr:hypothetical protein NMY22_g17440 [Coprinellus aureogranulatus]